MVAGTGVSVAFFEPIVEILLLPAQGRLSSAGGGPIYTELTELLGITVKIALLGGLVLALPVIAYQLIMFVGPGLTPRERRYAFAVFPGALVSFAGGVAFAFFVVLPPSLRFLLTYGSGIAAPMIRISNYISLVVTMLFWMGLVFETPLIMFLLSKLGVVSARTLARGRRYIVVLAFVLGAIVTPTFDPLNQALMAAPLIVLYELGIWLARLGQWRAKPAR
jgi:sec-independent protein translocase protein TatC